MGQPSDEVVRRVYAEEWVRAALRQGLSRAVVAHEAAAATTRRTGVPPARVREVADQAETRALLVPQRRERVG